MLTVLNKKFICFFIILFVLFSNCAKSNKEYTPGTSFLWEVKPKSDTTKIAYLLGSVHLAVPEIYPLNSVIMEAWDKSDVLAVEVDINSIDMNALSSDMSLVSKLFNFSEKLSSKLPENIYIKVKEHLLATGFAPEIIDLLTPLGAALLLELGNIFENNDNGNTIVDGIDMFFLKEAKRIDRKIVEVESLAKQMEILETLNVNDNIIPYIESTLERLDSQATEKSNAIYDILMAWKNGDLDYFEKITNSPFSPDSAVSKTIKDALFYKRNIEMTAKIEDYIQTKDVYFVVLGTAHYVGEGSIVDILQKTNKYIIRRL